MQSFWLDECRHTVSPLDGAEGVQGWAALAARLAGPACARASVTVTTSPAFFFSRRSKANVPNVLSRAPVIVLRDMRCKDGISARRIGAIVARFERRFLASLARSEQDSRSWAAVPGC